MATKLSFKFIAFTLLLCSFSFAANLDMTRYWIQDRFIRSISLAQTDSEKLQAFSALINAIEQYKNSSIQTINVHTSNELQQFRYQFLHPQTSSEMEIQNFKNGSLPAFLRINSDNMQTQEKISQLTQAYKELIDYEFDFPPKNFKTQFLSFLGILSERRVGIFDLLFENSRDSKLTLNSLKKMQSTEILFYLNRFQDQTKQLFNIVRNSGESILSMNKITLKDPRASRFINLVLQEYFKYLPDQAIWNFIFLQLENPEVKSPLERFRLFSRNVGPHFHKLFQILAENSDIPPELSEIFQSFQEDLPAASKNLVKQIIETTVFGDFEILRYDEVPIKVGSMAQIHRTTVRFKNGMETTLALRILKPQTSEWVERDNQFLEHLTSLVAQDPILSSSAEGIDYKQLLGELKLLVSEEMDIQLTIKNENLARKEMNDKSFMLPNGQKVNFEVPKAFSSNNKNVMAMEWVNGDNFSDFFNKNPKIGQAVAENLFQTWLESVLFGGGFLHADLHKGNIRIEEIPEDNKIKLHILDFGMSGQMSQEQQGNFILLAGAAAINNYRLVARALWEMAVKKPNLQIQELEDLLKAHFQNNTGSFTFEKIIFYAMRNGFSFDSNFIKLVRGYAAVGGLLSYTNSSKKPKDFVLSLLKENPKQSMKLFTSLKAVNKEDLQGVFLSMGLGIKNIIETTKPEEIISKGQELFSQGKSLLGGFFKKTNIKGFFNTENKCLIYYKGLN